jgi:GNAT superfamily N-acetyltransferase
MAANEVMDKIHKARVPGPHWYLFGVAVDPELHGQGIGSAIIREGLAVADRESKPCYLETSEPRNLALYFRKPPSARVDHRRGRCFESRNPHRRKRAGKGNEQANQRLQPTATRLARTTDCGAALLRELEPG